MAYEVRLTSAAEKSIARLPREIRRRVAHRLVGLATNPRPPGSIKLAGEDAYRIRIGDYRIIYTIFDTQLVVLVIDVGHRRDIYRR